MNNETLTRLAGAIYERDEDYYLEDIVFLVEGRLFKFPRRAFETQSEVFRNMFASPQPEGQAPDGSGDDHPLLLDGYTQHDFKALLKVMLPNEVGNHDSLTDEELVGVLKLATVWEMNGIRKLVFEAVASRPMALAKKASIGLQHRVRELAIPALNALARRHTFLTEQEGNILGMDNVIKLVQVREITTAVRFTAESTRKGYATIAECPRDALDYTEFISSVFSTSTWPT